MKKVTLKKIKITKLDNWEKNIIKGGRFENAGTEQQSVNPPCYVLSEKNPC